MTLMGMGEDKMDEAVPHNPRMCHAETQSSGRLVLPADDADLR